MRRIAAITCAILGGAALAGARRNDRDLPAYEPLPSLEQVFAVPARSRKAPLELAVPGQWFRVEGVTFTGNLRRAGVEAHELLVAWRNQRDENPDAGQKISADEFPAVRVELEQDGHRYWLFMTALELQRLQEHKAPELLTVFVQRIGFVSGDPKVLLYAFGEPQKVQNALEIMRKRSSAAAPAVPPPPPPEPQAGDAM